MQNRVLNAKRNIAWGLIQKGLQIVMGFVLQTAIIHWLGSVYLGLNTLFTSILHVLTLTELGFGEAMVFSMYKPLAEGDTDTICALLKLYKRFYILIGSIVAVLGLILIPFLPILITGSVPSDVNLTVLYLIYLSNTVISYFLFAYKESILIASQRSDICSNLSTIKMILLYAAQIAAIAIFHNYLVFCILIPVFTVVRNIGIKLAVDKMYPGFTCRGELSKDIIGDIKKRVIGLFTYKVCGVFRSSFDSIILSAYLGLIELAKYQNYMYLMTAVSSVTSIMTSGIIAGVGNSIVTESKKKNYEDFEKFQLIYLFFISWCTVCLYVLYQPFIELWVGKDLLLSNTIKAIFCSYFFVQHMGDISYVYRQATGIWYEDRFRPVVEAVANLTLNILLVRSIGMSGVLLSTVVCVVFINCLWGVKVLYKSYFDGFKVTRYYARMLYFAAATALGCFATERICGLIPTKGIPFIAVSLILCLIVPNLINAVLLKPLPEYGSALAFIRQRFLRRKR